MEWKPISTASFDRELELAVFDYDGTHVLGFRAAGLLAVGSTPKSSIASKCYLRIGGHGNIALSATASDRRSSAAIHAGHTPRFLS
jgi:hypothetical protein